MKIQDYFMLCEEKIPEKRTDLRRISFALRRGGVDTLEQLLAMYQQYPEEISKLRDVGTQSIVIINQVIQLLEEGEAYEFIKPIGAGE